MKFDVIAIAVALAGSACGGSYPAPTQRMADATGAARSAEELGAARNPQSSLYLKLAREELDQARALLERNENKRADYVLIRAKADAELALALQREATAH